MGGNQTDIETEVNKIDYPNQTSGWGRTLIDILNSNLIKIQMQIRGINDNIGEKFRSFKKDIESIKSTSDAALQLAQENKKNIEDLRAEQKNNNDEIKEEINYLKFTCEDLLSENKSLKQHTNNLENYSRRNNIVIRGVAESRGENNADCANKARNFLINKLMLQADVVNRMVFVRCHRLGGYDKRRQYQKFHQANDGQQKRPIIIRFSNYSDKALVWSARGQISDDSVFISENYSSDTEYKRRKLYTILKKAKTLDDYKMKCSLNGDVLVLNSVRYTVDTLSDLPADLKPRQFSEKSDGKCLAFGGYFSDYSPFSNWFPCQIRYRGRTFKNVEQAYQYAKAIYGKDAATAMKLLYSTDPRVAKDLGAKVKGLAGSKWETDKYNIMKELVMSKFTDNTDLKTVLLDTGTMILAESGYDEHYAIGLPLTSKDVFNTGKWSGKNKLGEILCKVRECILKL